MARPLNMDILQQNFWKEAYFKEVVLRFNWHKKYGSLLQAQEERYRDRPKAASQTTLKLPPVEAMPPEKPKTPPQLCPPTEPPVERDLMGVDMKVLEAEMKPAPREVRALLYQGISHEDEGRYRYLKTRALLRPEEKYTFPITTNFLYGWQMGNMATSYVGPTPKCRIESFFRKNGAFSQLHPRDVAL